LPQPYVNLKRYRGKRKTVNDLYQSILNELKIRNVQLVAVSKTQPIEAILDLYHRGQRDFGENRVQELLPKYEALPKDIRWHLIGHLQSNKVKYIAPFVHLIHSVDSLDLLDEIEKQALKNNRTIDCLLQFHVAQESSKYGISPDAPASWTPGQFDAWPHVRICGVMGMATFTEDMALVRREFQLLHRIFDDLKRSLFSDNEHFQQLSMGMSDDYPVAIEEGSTMVRIGTLLFGYR
jgi:pyridoxal phosphate enzyme (YggS family)